MVAVGHNDITDIKAKNGGVKSHIQTCCIKFSWDVDVHLLLKKIYDNFL